MIVAAIWLTALIVAGAALIFPWWVLAIGFALGVAVVLRAWWWAHTWAERAGRHAGDKKKSPRNH